MAHVTVLRNAMLEVRWGEAQASWLELGRPALKSLRGMAGGGRTQRAGRRAGRIRRRAADGARAGTASRGDRRLP